MNPNQLAAFNNIEQAQQALKSGDKNAARQFAAQAAQLAPELEEVWLIMAALASPRGSVAYLEKALNINPNSERAQKGLIWAQKRVQQELAARSIMVETPSVQQPEPLIKDEESAASSDMVSEVEEPAVFPEPVPVVLPEPTPPLLDSAPAKSAGGKKPAFKLPVLSKEAVVRSRYSYITLLVIIICLAMAWVSWQGATPVSEFLSSSAFTGQEHGPAWAKVNILKSDATQSPEINFQATAAPIATALEPASEAVLISPTPAFTPTQTPTLTFVATALPSQEQQAESTGETLAPTIIFTPPAPTATPPPTAQATAPVDFRNGTGSAEQPSPTPLPTDTAVPFSTQSPDVNLRATPTAISNDNVSSETAGRWLDVDLTHQMIYAYEGNTLVNSFVVSTGTWQYPTVTGQYHVYVKYRYKDMSGPGYYLPNVPFTMFFYQGYAIHGTYWHNNFGTPMSHGCVNLSIPDSEWVFNWASVGTLVNVHY